MAQTNRSKFLSILRANEAAMKALFAELSAQIGAEIMRRADRDGNLPRSAAVDLRRVMDERVTALFVGRDRHGKLAPFDASPDGRVLPLSPYARVLWQNIRSATRLPVEQNAATMAARLPPDLLMRMRAANRSPFPASNHAVSEQVFRPNPLAKYRPAHQWVDPNGYRLSDRIWNTAEDTRRRLDLFLEDAIRSGRGALNLQDKGATGIARDLERFLVPGKQLPVTNKPYGIDASYNAMRLARTEISRAHAEAAQVSAAMNPFVQGLVWNLSGSHPQPDICDDFAAGSPYPVDEFPTMPAHPHCLCYTSYALMPAAESNAILDELRADVRRTRAELVDKVGPLEVDRFTDMLLGQGMSVTHTLGVAA